MLDEAFWLLFLFVHFGRHRRGGWRYARDVYGRLGLGPPWDWRAVSTNIQAFSEWITDNAAAIRSRGPGGFGNHRKYESLAKSGAVAASYVDWVGPMHSHKHRIDQVIGTAATPEDAFGALYHSMATVRRFGRTARFDYLSTASHLGLVNVTADRAHLKGSSGPLRGARLLLGRRANRLSTGEIDSELIILGQYLEIGLDIVEDSLCNWQKSPDQFMPFRG
jgi:hypothetical protein